MNILGVETACDDTAVAVVRDGLEVKSNLVWSQKDVHAEFEGVVPELAARRHAEVIMSAIERSLRWAEIGRAEIDAIAVNNQHGLLRSIVVGVAAAKGLAIGLGKPFVPVHHVEGHIYSAVLSHPNIPFPHLCLAVAGGHNLLIHARSIGDYEIVGRSIDDAAGEAFDKVGKELGLPFPGGPAVEKLARGGDAARFDLPRPLLTRPNFDFSFSGLKTAVKTVIARTPDMDDQARADLAASFQRAVIEVLTRKSLRAASALGLRDIAVVGGVAANGPLRAQLTETAAQDGVDVWITERAYCTDNAAMIAGLAYHKLGAPDFNAAQALMAEASPNAPLGLRAETYR